MSGGIGLTKGVNDYDRLIQTQAGYKAWTMTPGMATAATAPSTGLVEGTMAVFRAGDVITNLHCVTGTAASGITLAKMAIFSVDGATQYGVTADIQASLTANTLGAGALTSTWTVPATDAYMIAFLHVKAGGTSPTLYRAGGWPQTRKPTSSTYSTAMKSTATGLSDMPATVTWTTAADYLFFFGAT